MVLVTTSTCFGQSAYGVTLYVSTYGRDTWSGRLPEPNAAGTDGPVATVTRALDLARQRRGRSKDGFRILLRRGTYYLERTVTLGPGDSGSEAFPTRVEAFEHERPRLVAGRAIRDWQPYQGEIVRCDLKAIGLEGAVFRQLFYNGQRQVLARYPNFDPHKPYSGGWLYVEAPGTKGSKRDFRAAAGDLKPWQDISQAEAFFFHRYSWYNTIVAIRSIDRQTRNVTLTQDTYDEIVGDGAERYYLQNLLEELDSPGEWYLDRKTSTLYFWPPGPVERALVEAPTLDFAVHIMPGTERVVVQGLTIEVARRTGVQVEQARSCLIAKNVVRHCGTGTRIGGWGTWENCCGIGLFGGSQNAAVGNDISDVGGHGVKLTGGDRKTLTPAGNRAENNHIHHTGVYWKQGCGARLEGVGNRFAHNLVHDCPRMAVIFGGNDQVIEFNHLHHVNTETCDTGAIYTGGRDGLSPRGSLIRYNYIHDIGGFGRQGRKWTCPYYSWGIYLDDLASGVHVFGNIVVGAVRGGVHIHNGRDNRIENNVLAAAQEQQVEFNGWAKGHRALESRQAQIERNWEGHRALPAWRKYARLFAQHPRDWVQMAGNQILRNVIVASVPGSGVYRHRLLPLELTEFDYNLIWAHGQPVRTGVTSVRSVGEAELCPNPGFEDAALGQMPRAWGWYVRPSEAAQATACDQTRRSGGKALRVRCASAKDDEARFRYVMLKTGNIPVKPGKSYRLAAWFLADTPNMHVNLVAQSWRAKQHHWARETSAAVGQQWQQVELVLTVPGPQDADFIPTLSDFYIRVDFRANTGVCWLDDVSLREAVPMDEWDAWRSLGLDGHSVIAEPRLVDPDKHDYRLRSDSPAFKLGFKPIPVGKIGPYQDPLRASWPLAEANPR